MTGGHGNNTMASEGCRSRHAHNARAREMVGTHSPNRSWSPQGKCFPWSRGCRQRRRSDLLTRRTSPPGTGGQERTPHPFRNADRARQGHLMVLTGLMTEDDVQYDPAGQRFYGNKRNEGKNACTHMQARPHITRGESHTHPKLQAKRPPHTAYARLHTIVAEPGAQ